MPFTFSHPALVLPLARVPKRWLSLTGLVAGSVTPDFEYFLRIDVKGTIGHTLSGLFLFCLPLGILLSLLFHAVVRDELIKNLPRFVRSRLTVYQQQNWPAYFRKHVPVVAVSVLIGACSHLLWDSFTHAPGFMVKQLPALAGMVAIGSWQFPVYSLLQYLSTLVGALVILYAILQLPLQEPAAKKMPFSLRYWLIVLLSVVLTVAAAYLLGRSLHKPVTLIVVLTSGGLLGLVLAGIISKQKGSSLSGN